MVTVNRIEGDFKDAYNFSVTFEHKKIVQESPIFRMDSRTSVVDVNCIFHQFSPFYQDKKSGKWSGKDCWVSLGYYTNNLKTRVVVGKPLFNLSSIVDKQNVERAMTFTNFFNSREKCTLMMTFRVDSKVTQGSTGSKQGLVAVLDNPNIKDFSTPAERSSSNIITNDSTILLSSSSSLHFKPQMVIEFSKDMYED